MNNIRIRVELTKCGVKYWELARLMEISVPTLNRRLRDELPAEEQDRIVKLIQQHGGGREHDSE